MSCDKALQELIYDNFCAYFQSQMYHLNVTGQNFQQLHSLFGEVYDYLYDWHDKLNEQLRQMGPKVVTDMVTYLDKTKIADAKQGASAMAMVGDIAKSLAFLQEKATRLYDEAGVEGEAGLETLVGDYITGVSKLHWKLAATLAP